MGGVWLSQDERLKKTGVAGIEAHSKRIKKQLDMTLCHHVMSNVFFSRPRNVLLRGPFLEAINSW